MAELPSDWSEFLSCLNARRVRYLVIGAHALAAAGRPRATLDLDVLVEPSVTNARRLGLALADFGFPRLAEQASVFASGDRMATLGREPLRIDVLNKLTGVSFARAWRGRTRTRMGVVPVHVLGRRELIANKRATGRTKDLLDLALLEEGAPARRRRRAR